MNEKVKQRIDALLEQMRDREDEYLNRHKHIRSEEDIAKERAYWERVWSAPTTQPKIKLPTLPTKSQIPYELARKKLASVAKEKAALAGRKFTLTPDEAAMWQQALKWIIFDRTCKIDLSRDLYLFGGTGAGKTFLAQCLIETINHFAPTAHFSERDRFQWGFVELNTLYEDCVSNKSFDPITSKLSGNWVFDELINEPRTIKIYSNEYRFFERILTKREAGQAPKRAIYISNAIEPDLLAYYNSSRFTSRWKARVATKWVFKTPDKRI